MSDEGVEQLKPDWETPCTLLVYKDIHVAMHSSSECPHGSLSRAPKGGHLALQHDVEVVLNLRPWSKFNRLAPCTLLRLRRYGSVSVRQPARPGNPPASSRTALKGGGDLAEPPGASSVRPLACRSVVALVVVRNILGRASRFRCTFRRRYVPDELHEFLLAHSGGNSTMSYSLHRTLTPPSSRNAGPVNAVVFLDNGNKLASGGDDQALRVWDVLSGDCYQELREPHWGQITNLSLMQDGAGSLDLFVGTGRGVVSVYPWNQQSQHLDKKAGRSTDVFKLDEPVESQAVDSIRSQFAVASIQGQIKLFLVQNRTVLVPVWTLVLDSNVPRSLLFLGDNNEQLAVHNLRPGPISFLDSITGKLAPPTLELRGGVGSVAVSPDRRMKAVHNISADKFDLYGPGSRAPIGLRVSSSSGKIKGVAFGEGGKVLVCGGDDGFIHIFDAADGVEQESLTHSDCSTVYALTTCTTRDYHLIASGGSELPAAIYIWGKPTEYKDAIDRSDAMEREAAAARAVKMARAKDKVAREARAAREAEAKIADLTRTVREINEGRVWWTVLVVFCAAAWYARGALAALFNKWGGSLEMGSDGEAA
ncbi:WD40-repeat-containing domain protein [Mycena galericulata]|nr:WD40-repeat-containing domain protein [Mycena galericulata]